MASELRNINRVLAAAIIAATVVGAMAWTCLGFYAEDDHYYRLTMKPGWTIDMDTPPSEAPELHTFGQSWVSMVNHTHYQGRLGQMLLILTMPGGHTAQAAVLALAWAAMYGAFCVWCRRRGGRGPLIPALVAAVMWLGYPWGEGFQSLSFQVNYVAASALMLALILALERGRVSTIGLALLSVVTAWWQEGNGAAMLAYVAAAWMWGSLRGRPRTVITAGAGLVIGLICNLGLGTAYRIAASSGSEPIGMQFAVQFAGRLVPEFIALTLFCIEYIFGKRRASALRIYAPLLIAMTAGVAMAFILHRADRTLWTASTFAWLVAAGILGRWLSQIRAARQAGMSAIFLCVYAWWLIQMCVAESAIGRENRLIDRECGPYSSGRPTVIFAHHTANADIAWWLFGTVVNPTDDVTSGTGFHGLYLDSAGLSPMVLPPELEGLLFEQWPRVPGRNDLRGVWPVVAISDTIASKRYTLTVGPVAQANMSPADKLLAWLKAGCTDRQASVDCRLDTLRVRMPDGATNVYRLIPEPLGRTIKGRPFVRIDAHP